jgi:hypothetical protein
MNAGLSIQATERPWEGLGVLAAYTGGALLTGTILFKARDA